MHRLTVLLLMAVCGPALAAQTGLTLDQFQTSTLPSLQGMRDNRAARMLTGLRLTERAGIERAAQWKSEMPGQRSSEALMALIDNAAFLDPPAAEMPAAPAPDQQTQKEILARTAEQVQAMLHKLPDFYAVRSTTHFETATPEQLAGQQEALGSFSLQQTKFPHQEIGPVDRGKPALGRLFFLSTTQQSVTYRDRREEEGPVTGTSEAVRGSSFDLTTSGEFGPVLQMVLTDALARGLSWSHWEQGANGSLAVFQYDVPRDQSHYQVLGDMGERSYYPAFHGELGIDPASGAILRITIHASSPAAPGQLLDSSILVEYAPVDIGGHTYICPVHGVAIATGHGVDEPEEKMLLYPRAKFLNDVTFTGYHVFRADTRILPAK